MAVKQIIFDFDGTLADTAVLTLAAFNNILPKYGVPVPPVETVRAAIGYQSPDFYYHIFNGLSDEVMNKIIEESEPEEQKILYAGKNDLLFKGVKKLLSDLAEKNTGCIS